jgi:hypothetical protein
MDSFSGDYYGYRCHKGKKSSDIFNDYLDLLDGVLAYDEYGNIICYRVSTDVLPMIKT